MFVEGFSASTVLSAVTCPRCRALGLSEIDCDDYSAAPASDKYQATHHIDPSVTARCPACGLVMELPGCLED